MNRKFKTLGLVLAAVFAMSALGASAASAAVEFHSTTVPVGVTGTQTTGHVFTTNAGTVTCTTATFSGTAVGTKVKEGEKEVTVPTSTTQTLTPSYSGCKAFGFINVPIDINGCGYIFNANGTTNVECPAGKSIQVTTPGCTTSIGAQHLASGMTYTTIGTAPNRHVTAHTAISGIAYDECGTPRTNGTYHGSTTVKSASGEIWVA